MDSDPEAWVAAELARLQRQDGQLDQMAEVVAGLVLGRTEHARVIRELVASVDRHEEAVATAQAGIEDVRRAVAHLAGRINGLDVRTAQEIYDSVEEDVLDIEERLAKIEHAMPVIEGKLKLRRSSAWERSTGTLPP